MSIVYTGKLDEKVNRRVSTVGRASTVGTIGLDKKAAVNEKGGDRSG